MNCAPCVNRAGYVAHILLCKKEKQPLGLQISSQIEKTKKSYSEFKDCREHHRLCNILIMFTYLMMWKLFYLLMTYLLNKDLINCVH